TEKKKMLAADALKRYEAQQEEIRKQEDIIRKFKERGTEKLAKRAQSREKRLAHMEVLDKPQQLNAKLKIRFKENFASGNDVLYGEDLSKSFIGDSGVRHLFSNVNFDIKRGERICMVGPNGVGKTSLLKIILGQLLPDTGYVRIGHNVEFGYYDQEQNLLTNSNTVLDELHNTYRLYTETELRSLLGRFLFRGEDVFKYVGDLSGGEKARLSLLKIMMSGANCLLMDEPTNHLDIASKEIFEDALLEFPGTLFVISHDRYFLNKISTKIVELSDSGLTHYAGGYDYYLEKKESLGSGKSYLNEMAQSSNSSASAGKSGAAAVSEKEQRAMERQAQKDLQAQRRRLERQMTKAEEDIARLEETIAELEGLLCLEEVYIDFQKSAEISEKLEQSKSELEVTYTQWMELQEQLGEL
ncbi:MAG: ABC-F family ATP-binding cassette domain-containing protein, partial [Firmicutes bacterium]|nr:ABC-F family ATP-binding cassette domain-containing protein [Bacillota bacterium]